MGEGLICTVINDLNHPNSVSHLKVFYTISTRFLLASDSELDLQQVFYIFLPSLFENTDHVFFASFQHCIKGKTIYAPEIVFLKCGGSSSKPKGAWYHDSYGTIAMYKQDWNDWGGFSPGFRQKTTWGGEDWDLIDNAVKGGLEIERNRSPWVYHYHHSKVGMWNNI